MGQDKFDVIKKENGYSDQEMIERGIRVIHPAFRLFALAEPPSVGTARGQWLSPEILSMFSFHDMRALSQKEEAEVLTQMIGTSGEVLEDILRVTHKLRSSEDGALRSIATNMSTRQLLRIARFRGWCSEKYCYKHVHKAASENCKETSEVL